MTFLRLYLQTLALSFLFAGTGHFIYRTQFARSSREATSLRWAASYFLGLSAFLPVLLFVSRVLGAEAALWIALGLMGAMSLAEAAALWRRGARLPWKLGSVFLLLLLGYSVTNAALWVLPLPPSAEPGLFHHLGSIHSGRYANYAIFIAGHDRIPRLAQNGGQSILASVHLLLGVDSPLAALMVWLPFSMAFLTLLIFGLFRSAGFPSLPCTAATFLVMFCNVAISTVHVFLFDNGSPLAFIGYTDMIAAVATFMLFCRWFQADLVGEERSPGTRLLLPALLGMTWAWYAPQNIVIACAAGAGTAAVWTGKGRSASGRRRVVHVAFVFAISAAVGATQFGSLLPAGLRENTGFWTQGLSSSVAIRPHIEYLRNHWTAKRWKTTEESGLIEREYAAGTSTGADEVYRNVAWFVEENLWDSVRIYGFPFLGLLLFGLRSRSSPSDLAESDRAWRTWFWMSTFAFGAGYLVSFCLELGRMKWWLTRFLVPGSAMALSCLGFAALGCLGNMGKARRRVVWALLLVAATVGPTTELVAEAVRNFANRRDPVIARLGLIAREKGPFLFESLLADPRAAEADAGRFVVGGDGRQQGKALVSPVMPILPGRYRIAYRIDASSATTSASPLLDLDVALQKGDVVIARRAIRKEDLKQLGNGYWACLDIEIPRGTEDGQFRLWNRSEAGFAVTAMRLERR